MALQWRRTSIYYEGYILKSPSYTYRIGSVLGCGGFGITYLASAIVKVGNVSLKGRFAIKEHYYEKAHANGCGRWATQALEKISAKYK